MRREIKAKILELKSSIKALTERCNTEVSKFVSKKYDTAIAALQSVKSQTANLDKYTTITNSLEDKLGELAKQSTNKISHCIESNALFMKLNSI